MSTPSVLFEDTEQASRLFFLSTQNSVLLSALVEFQTIVRDNKEPSVALNKIRDRLKTLPCKSVDWEKFDTQFKAAHPEFTKKLLERFPDLTPMQIRTCSLLRMNLKSEEIGRLLCLTERNIENHRYRIRKKMALKREEDLSIVLAKL